MNKKMLKIIIIIFIVIDLLIVGFIILKKKTDRSIVDKGNSEYIPEIKDLSYYEGGGELGGYYRIDLVDYCLTIDSLEASNLDVISQTCEITNELYLKLNEIIEEYHLKDLGELPLSEIQILDGETRSLNIVLAGGEEIKLGDSYQMDNKTKEAFHKLVEILKEYDQ